MGDAVTIPGGLNRVHRIGPRVAAVRGAAADHPAGALYPASAHQEADGGAAKDVCGRGLARGLGHGGAARLWDATLPPREGRYHRGGPPHRVPFAC